MCIPFDVKVSYLNVAELSEHTITPLKPTRSFIIANSVTIIICLLLKFFYPTTERLKH